MNGGSENPTTPPRDLTVGEPVHPTEVELQPDDRMRLLAHMSDDEVHPSDLDTAGTGEDWEQVRWVSGVEPPWEYRKGDGPRCVVRTFCFLDLCGSTSYLETAGALAATEVVTSFRNLVREVSSRRGVRIAKWLGDGAMLVGVNSGPILASAVEICRRWRGIELGVRAGVSLSMALLMDGDDYLARGANFAARICDAAGPGEVLCDTDCMDHLPTWIETVESRTVDVRGMGVHEVAVLAMDPRHHWPRT